tara:strand:+ start:115 stop:357 length:243 start_codon:yes stop_codon:yes gene_type:complete
MKNINLKIFTALIILISLLGVVKIFHLNLSIRSKNAEKILLKESIRVLNECFNLENKNKRKLKESIELIEYCIREFGYKK